MAGAAGHAFAPRLPRRAVLAGALVALLVGPAAAVLLTEDHPAPPPDVRVEEVRVGTLPTDIAVGQGRVWVPSAGSDELVAIDDRARPVREAT